MKKIITFLLTAFCLFGFSQSRRTNSYIKKLNNNQFIINQEQKASFKMESPAALKLIKIGKPATEKLISALSDTTKTIMAHLVLCHIYFKKATFAGPKVFATDNGDLLKYYLGDEKGEGLVISQVMVKGNYKTFIMPGDLEEIIRYWKRKSATAKKS